MVPRLPMAKKPPGAMQRCVIMGRAFHGLLCTPIGLHVFMSTFLRSVAPSYHLPLPPPLPTSTPQLYGLPPRCYVPRLFAHRRPFDPPLVGPPALSIDAVARHVHAAWVAAAAHGATPTASPPPQPLSGAPSSAPTSALEGCPVRVLGARGDDDKRAHELWMRWSAGARLRWARRGWGSGWDRAAWRRAKVEGRAAEAVCVLNEKLGAGDEEASCGEGELGAPLDAQGLTAEEDNVNFDDEEELTFQRALGVVMSTPRSRKLRVPPSADESGTRSCSSAEEVAPGESREENEWSSG